ncbi:MAG: hypothetical protein DMF97_21145 [Acidobacteria bacterium]|nr:MAG: hypothetical protein DMF97_21145 [Acidobacteriota bacterium]
MFRSLKPPFLRRVKVGPSLAKIPLDALLTLSVLRRALSCRYDAVHSHEEAGLIGATLALLLRIPHLYDMHSSLPQQLSNFSFSRSRSMKRLFLEIERFMIRRSRVVVVICPALQETVLAIEPHAHTVVIENAPGSTGDRATPAEAAAVRCAHGLAAETPLVVYTGTFEAYQGLDMLFGAMASVVGVRPDARLVLAGGQPDQIEQARAQARASGVEAATVFAGERPAAQIPAYLLAADVLVSPRSRGTNTPLKIYQYLRSGRPIVATRLVTHTQVLSDGAHSAPARKRSGAQGPPRATEPGFGAEPRRRTKRSGAQGPPRATPGSPRRGLSAVGWCEPGFGAPPRPRTSRDAQDRPLQLYDVRRSGDGAIVR